MAVWLSDGKRDLRYIVHHILDTFAAELDYARGVFLKPNIVFPVRQDSGEITSLSLVRTLISTLRERNGTIDIILGEGVAAGCDPWENFRVSGYARLAQDLHVPLLDLHVAERQTVAWEYGKLSLPCVALERTYISLPILKPSSACVISGALKNQKGLLLPAAKKQFHHLGLHEPIAELNRVLQPSLSILDGSRFFGDNVLLAGNNCGEIDATACELLGIDEPEHVQLSRTVGVFSPGYAIDGDLRDIRLRAARPEAKEFKQVGRLRLWSNPRACTMCRYLFHDVKGALLEGRNLSAAAKLLVLSVTGAEIVIGSNPQWRQEYDTVICVGACTRRVAREGGFLHVPGCPPTSADFLDCISQVGKSEKNKT